MKKLLLYASIAAIAFTAPALTAEQQPNQTQRFARAARHSVIAWIGGMCGVVACELAVKVPFKFQVNGSERGLDDIVGVGVLAFLGYHAAMAGYDAYKAIEPELSKFYYDACGYKR